MASLSVSDRIHREIKDLCFRKGLKIKAWIAEVVEKALESEGISQSENEE
jgi:hypothetical protein